MWLYGGRETRVGEARGAVSAVSEAFRWSGANLLPFTKFIANGLFTK